MPQATNMLRTITLWQPWASLVVIGAKTWETRSWDTSYRGPLVIHAAQRWTPNQRALTAQEPFKSALMEAGIYDLPLGKVLGKVRLIYTTQCPETGMITLPHLFDPYKMHEPERTFGDYAAGRYAWELRDPERLSIPIPASGHQGFWQFDYPESDG